MDIITTIANELSIATSKVRSAVTLLDSGDTVPFIARYRKEATGNLDDTQLRNLAERLVYLRELQDRKTTVLKSIDSQKLLTEKLKKQIENTLNKTTLEDIYLPFKPKRRTKAKKAIEAGLEPLASQLLNEQKGDLQQLARAYINKDPAFDDETAVLEGAKQILMERFSEDALLINNLRESVWKEGVIKAQVVAGKEQIGVKFKDYFNYEENIAKIPSHRALALFRGRNEGILNVNLLAGADEIKASENATQQICSAFSIRNENNECAKWLLGVAKWAWKIKIFTRIDLDLKSRLKDNADVEAINVFARNLNDILLAAPAGAKVTMGLDPGIRTGVKVAVVDATGKVLDTETIYPHQPKNWWDKSISQIHTLIKKYNVTLISIGNGTASRETEKLVKDCFKQHKDLNCQFLMVSEAGASIYSASELASKELPNMDVSLRGAVSIARRLQDPLAELVKIDSKSIGVGQYQHDVNQFKLNQKLNNVVEDCVNAVGVDVNTASPALLKAVAGLSDTISTNIVNYREQNGRFNNRKQLLKVPRLGDKAYQQSAGFLRIVDGDNPLDQSAVHPESYPIVSNILKSINANIKNVLGNDKALTNCKAHDFVNDTIGLPTVLDIFSELKKPGRDPRPEFKTAEFIEGVETIKDLQIDMVLEGVVTNVTNFGAFVDVGVHQDGLVHISNMADKFIKTPSDVVKSGDVVKVQVMEVDAVRKRIALTMKLNANKAEAKPKTPKKTQKQANQKTASTGFGDALKLAIKK